METTLVIIFVILAVIAGAAVAWVLATKKQSSLKEELYSVKASEQSQKRTIESLKLEKATKEEELNLANKTITSAKEESAKAVQAKDSLQEQLAKLEQRLAAANTKLDEQSGKYTALMSQHAALKEKQSERDASFAQQLENLEEQKQVLKKEFENLANKIFEEKGKTFTQSSQTSLDSMLKPFKDQIQGFQTRINQIHESSVEGNTNLKAEIHKVLEVGLKMQSEATNLTSALKGDSQQRGAWGEAQLERTLQMSGLLEDTHYTSQDSFTGVEGDRKRTDYIIRLPDNKCLIIDSKMNLPDYDRAVSAETEEEANIALKAHVAAVRKHIDDLAKKDYTDITGLESPDFILMFMPVEPAYIEALKHDKELFSYGYEKNIVLVSHTTLIPILRTVSNLWILEQSNREAKELGDKALDIYNSVCGVTDRMNKLGNSLKAAGNHYSDTVTALVGGQGLSGKVERFGQLSSKSKKKMKELDAIQIGGEDPRLQLEVKPLEEPEEIESTAEQVEAPTE